MTSKPLVVLTIAGSDPSGGAGVQADQRVIESLGCAAVSVITAITSQNTLGVATVFPVPPDVLKSQLTTLLDDIRPQVVKIGVLPSSAHIQVVAEVLEQYKLTNIVLDPVLAPTVGEAFNDRKETDNLRTLLFPVCDLITPNSPEAALLTDLAVTNLEEMKRAAAAMVSAGAKAVLMKGGHINSDEELVTDLLMNESGCQIFEERRVRTEHTHGTGCFLSSAIACHLALGLPLDVAIATAKQQLTAALKQPICLGAGRGYPGRIEC